MRRVRGMLARPVSVGAMLEALMWLALPYVVIGLAFTVVHPDHVRYREAQLQMWFPAGADVLAFGETTVWWPLLLVSGTGEDHCGAQR
ncbi:hypothetical protein HZU40_04520 [Mycolicibacterium fluoranthenivorans]|uniref:Uncharacterized protein n=1 Tax=Mycolicibacterium fluoranthenivorans TaxID=258505 RepID=A0A7G8PGY7_9MYCO|nr:hypothetical protein [Mycolicibacterium fluoranthenivorans]QNJ93603.1 hypothetical protein HZU40_04520 [Mycolicibacterium fluoranthenivorans]